MSLFLSVVVVVVVVVVVAGCAAVVVVSDGCDAFVLLLLPLLLLLHFCCSCCQCCRFCVVVRIHMSTLAVFQDPSFNPFVMDHSVDPPVRKPDYENENMKRVAEVCGASVCQDLMRAILELEEHNPSGRYSLLLCLISASSQLKLGTPWSSRGTSVTPGSCSPRRL